MYIKDEISEIKEMVRVLMDTLLTLAEAHTQTIMPGYTHLQKAQPVTFAHHVMAYFEMLRRDMGGLDDTDKRTNGCPLGSGALAAATYPLDREAVAHALDSIA